MEYLERQGKRIGVARRIKGLTQQELAEKLTAELGEYFGDDAKVSRIELGRQDVSSRELTALAGILGQPVTWLQGISDDFDDKNLRLRVLGLAAHLPQLHAA